MRISLACAWIVAGAVFFADAASAKAQLCSTCRPTCKVKTCCQPAADCLPASSVHPGVPFGYYPTQWQPYSGHRALPPAKLRPRNDAEPLPPPRPIEGERRSIILESARSARPEF